jgi:hypothetical protein
VVVSKTVRLAKRIGPAFDLTLVAQSTTVHTPSSASPSLPPLVSQWRLSDRNNVRHRSTRPSAAG